ncbi:MAG: SpoIIE family protein phosphatase [Candidatus Korobacteraceae bacterium]
MPAAVAQSVVPPPVTQSHKPRSVLFVAALLLAATSILYSAAWMYYVRRAPEVEIGIEESYSSAGVEIDKVHPDSPAEKAGLKPQDRIVALNGGSANSASGWTALLFRIWLNSNPGDIVTLTVQRPGQSQPLVIRSWFRVKEGVGDTKTLVRTIADQILESYPLLFLVVGLTVLFLRVGDRNAWLLALVFAAFITAADMPTEFAAAPPTLRSWLLAYRTLMGSVLTGLFYFFFAVFPTRSPIDRKVPWLKWALLVIGVCLSLGGYWHGNSMPFPFVLAVMPLHVALTAREVTAYGALLLGVVSLLLNVLSPTNAGDRRRLKVILWGTAVGITPIALVKAAEDFAGFQTPFWLNFADVSLLLLFPLSFGYAVVKHRVMDVPVLLKRSARYFVVERGFVILILAISVGLTIWFGQAFSRHFSSGSKAAIPVGATFGVLLVSGATQVHRRVRTRLDRAFFRSSYDAQQILENLAAKTLTVSSREGLAALLHDQIQDALHPSSMYVYLDASNGQLRAYAGAPPVEAMTLAANGTGLDELADRSEPLELLPEAMHGTQLQPLQPECLVPIRGSSEGQLQGVAVLGPRLSEESYSTSDKRLLASVASQAGIAMRSITLAEKMAATMEMERRSEQEMQYARQVQSRLLPQQAPSLATLECAGKCIQTRAVGGDYYDFLDLGSGRLGLVLADISGKGMSAALLMANLQANLRGQYALALEDIPRLLRSVNYLFFKNTESNNYATTFFAVYDDETRRLRYVNCGHNPPMLLRATGELERLNANATVLGLFEEWDCTVAEKQLAPGDVLVIYTDGVSEAGERDQSDSEEFGEERLIAVTRKLRQESADEIMEGILGEVQRFSPDEQADDMTLIVARGR